MIKIINKVILPVILITALVAFEIGCQYLCKALIPDETDKVYTHSKGTDTQLMVINDEDDSRFYPRMAAIKNKTMTVNEYLNDFYIQQFGKQEGEICSEMWDKSIDNMINESMTELENKLEMTVVVFSGIECQNLISAARIEQDTSLLYIQNHTMKVSEGKTKELSLIIRLTDLRVLYYQLSDPDSKEASPAEVNQTSKKLISDINSFLPGWYTVCFRNYAQDAEIYDNDEYSEEQNYAMDMEYDENNDYAEEQRKILTEQAKMLSFDYPDNKIASWFEKLFMNLSDEKYRFFFNSFEEKADETPYINIVTAIFQNDSEISVAFPFCLPGHNENSPEPEYHIYSSGDEIMIVFETGAKYQMILYYDVGEGCFTGFSA